MPSFQCHELLAKSQIFEKEPATTAENTKDRTDQESKNMYHAIVVSHFACGRQHRMLLKSQADRLLANDRDIPHSIVNVTSCVGKESEVTVRL